MKKYLFLFLLLLIPVLVPCKLYAMDISVGATTWFAKVDQQFSSNFSGFDGETKCDPGFLYGPVLSVKFNDDFNLTFVYLYGKFDISEEDQLSGLTSKYKLKRKDSDLALNYRLNNYFKAFLGLKYIGFNISQQYKSANMGEITDIKHNGYGPGLGLSATFPITDNVFLFGTVSGFYLWGKESRGFLWDPPNSGTLEADSTDYGINSNLSIVYYIAPASTTISLGGRFQYIKTDYRNITIAPPRYEVDVDNSGKTKFYGITLTATYSFGI